jgi:hypothetical protein
VPWFLVGDLHELLRQLGRCVSTCFLHSRNEGLGLRQLCAFLRLFLASSCDYFELRRSIDVVELRSKLHNTVQACQMELVCQLSAQRTGLWLVEAVPSRKVPSM